MKPPIKNVSLSFSCPEKWNSLVDVGDNKFCQKCNHIVVDFTKLSQEELDEAVRKNPGRLCGRFKPSQMKQPLVRYAAVTGVATALLMPVSCTEEVVLPTNIEPPPIPVESFEFPADEEEEFYHMGVFIELPDSISIDQLIDLPEDEGAQ
jgi:hypothetical protein